MEYHFTTYFSFDLFLFFSVWSSAEKGCCVHIRHAGVRTAKRLRRKTTLPPPSSSSSRPKYALSPEYRCVEGKRGGGGGEIKEERKLY